MKCPHCNVEVYESYDTYPIEDDINLHVMKCPNESCRKLIIELIEFSWHRYPGESAEISDIERISNRTLIYPQVSVRPNAPVEVDEHIAEDFNEACLVLSLSPKASAALSRRCLQGVLRDKAEVKHGSLANEIKQFIENAQAPTHLIKTVDAIRHFGNFAAHPLVDKKTGEIIDVEEGEAEWLLDILDMLFDFYYVQPELAKKKMDELNKKLEAAGKPLMK